MSRTVSNFCALPLSFSFHSASSRCFFFHRMFRDTTRVGRRITVDILTNCVTHLEEEHYREKPKEKKRKKEMRDKYIAASEAQT